MNRAQNDNATGLFCRHRHSSGLRRWRVLAIAGGTIFLAVGVLFLYQPRTPFQIIEQMFATTPDVRIQGQEFLVPKGAKVECSIKADGTRCLAVCFLLPWRGRKGMHLIRVAEEDFSSNDLRMLLAYNEYTVGRFGIDRETIRSKTSTLQGQVIFSRGYRKEALAVSLLFLEQSLVISYCGSQDGLRTLDRFLIKNGFPNELIAQMKSEDKWQPASEIPPMGNNTIEDFYGPLYRRVQRHVSMVCRASYAFLVLSCALFFVAVFLGRNRNVKSKTIHK